MHTHIEETSKGTVTSTNQSKKEFTTCFFKKLYNKSYLSPDQAVKGIIPWWITCSEDRWDHFFFNKKKKESKQSINLDKKNHQDMSSALNASLESELGS